MSKRTSLIVLLLSLSGLVFFFAPLLELPVVKFALFDLIRGAFAEGNWTPSRIILTIIFAALIISSLALMVSLYRAWRNPAVRLTTQSRGPP